MTPIRPQKEFPLLARYKKVFPVDEKTIFAYDGAIYCDFDLPPDLIAHEERHLAQQKRYGLEVWVENFLKDSKYRLKMEIDAYQYQLKSIKDREFRNKIRIESAKSLSGPLYGNIISKSDALRLLKV